MKNILILVVLAAIATAKNNDQISAQCKETCHVFIQDNVTQKTQDLQAKVNDGRLIVNYWSMTKDSWSKETTITTSILDEQGSQHNVTEVTIVCVGGIQTTTSCSSVKR